MKYIQKEDIAFYLIVTPHDISRIIKLFLVDIFNFFIVDLFCLRNQTIKHHAIMCTHVTG